MWHWHEQIHELYIQYVMYILCMLLWMSICGMYGVCVRPSHICLSCVNSLQPVTITITKAVLYYPVANKVFEKESFRSLHLLFCSRPGNKSYSKIASVIKNYKPCVSSSTVYPAVSCLLELHRENSSQVPVLSSFIFVFDTARSAVSFPQLVQVLMMPPISCRRLMMLLNWQ